MGKDFEVMITEPEREKEFLEVFGTNIVKVKSPIPNKIRIPSGEVKIAYMLDLKLITEEQREKLIKHISEKFKQNQSFVRENLDEIGVPILEDHCTTLIINNPQRWFD